MNRLFGFVSVAAIVITAACNSGAEEDGASNEQREEGVANVAEGEGTPQDHAAIMEARHEYYEEMGRAMKGISDQLKAGSPDVAAIQRHAALIAGYAPRIPGWFPEGSGPETGRKTRAKAEIWQEPEAFRAAQQRLERASAEFHRTAQIGDVDAIRAALPELGNSCKNCHDRFRGPEQD